MSLLCTAPSCPMQLVLPYSSGSFIKTTRMQGLIPAKHHINRNTPHLKATRQASTSTRLISACEGVAFKSGWRVAGRPQGVETQGVRGARQSMLPTMPPARSGLAAALPADPLGNPLEISGSPGLPGVAASDAAVHEQGVPRAATPGSPRGLCMPPHLLWRPTSNHTHWHHV